MRAMVLAAGLGRRMGPLTERQAKPVLPVLGRPLVRQILCWLGAHGIDEVVLNLHHRPESVRVALDRSHGPLPRVRYSEEPEILGTAGGLRRAAPLLRDGGTVVVCNSDFLSDIDLDAVLETHRRSGCAATLVLTAPRAPYSIVETDGAGRIVSLAGAPPTEAGQAAARHLFTGCQVIEDEVFERIPDELPSDLVRHVYRALAAEGRLGSHLHEGFWWEFGSLEQYLDGSLDLLDRPLPELRAICPDLDVPRRLASATVAIGPGAELHDEARLAGRVALGYSCFVGPRSHLEDCVVLPEAWIGAGCDLRRCIVDQSVEVPAGFAAGDALIHAGRDAGAGLVVQPLQPVARR